MVEKRSDLFSRQIYSVDASIHEVEPLLIFLPKNVVEVQEVVRLAHKNKVPIIARGAGTGLTGGCLGRGYILDLSKYFTKILYLNVEDQTVTVEPGVIQDQLNAYLKPHGLRLGPDTSTGNRATIGGMLANNAAGAHSLTYGRMADQVLEVEMVLSDGSLIVLKPGMHHALYDKIKIIAEKYKQEIEEHFPKTHRRSSGYSLDVLLKSPFNLATLVAGSEGSLGVITKIKMKLHPLPEKTYLSVLPFNSLFEALSCATSLLPLKPYSLEVIGQHIIEMGRLSPALQGHLDWLKGDPKALLLVEFLSDAPHFKEERVEAQEDVWRLRHAGVGLLLSRRSYSRAIAFVEDVAVPSDQVAPFMRDFEALLASKGKEAGIYGHAGPGCMHVRPYIDLGKASEVALMKEIIKEVLKLTLKYHGVLSGEHGDGLTRSYYNKALFGQTLYNAFCEIKEVFDPLHLMNPGKVVHAEEPFTKLRKTPQTSFETFFDFTREGGFALAVDLCNGNGECRKKEGMMCPTFQATQDEFLSTRARAQSLRSILSGNVSKKEFTSKELHNVLDLCIQCKGCKRECPSLVDMAKMKSEFLYHYNKAHGIPLRSKLFANIHKYSRLSLFTHIFGKWLGITDKRPIPKRAKKTFFEQIGTHLIQNDPSKEVLLYIDTFTDLFSPQIGFAAVKILQSLHYTIHLPKLPCCGRPHIAKGMLQEAKAHATNLTSQLVPFQKMPMITLEPSCLSALTDDYQDLIQSTPSSLSLESFLLDKPLSLISTPIDIAYHGHCHQKALETTTPALTLLKSLPGATVHEIPSTCCGMAGSFGYESEHYGLSMQIGETSLFPHIRKLSTTTQVVTTGFSCTHQILHGTSKKPLHIAELLASRLIESCKCTLDLFRN